MTMKTLAFPLRAVAALTLGLAASACDDATGLDGLDDDMVIDAAVLAADATIEEVTMWAQPLGFGALPVEGPAAINFPGRGPGRPGGGGSWTGDFSGTRSIMFFDELGVEQDAYDDLTTESIEIERDIAGSIERDNFSAEVSRQRSMIVSGLAGEETTRTWNGEGSSSVQRSGVLEDGTERSHSVEGDFTFEDVVVPIPGSDPRYPLSGTITRSMTVTRTNGDVTEVREVEIVITFDGSATAVAVVNGEAMEIDLSAGVGRNPLRRRG
jgi:hypothetical protein